MSNIFKWVFVLGLAMLMLAGCGTVAEVEPAAVVESATVASATISSAARTTNATATLTAVPATLTAVPATSTVVPATSTTVPPTDAPPLSEEPTAAATAVLAAKPQLLEFHTEW